MLLYMYNILFVKDVYYKYVIIYILYIIFDFFIKIIILNLYTNIIYIKNLANFLVKYFIYKLIFFKDNNLFLINII